MKINNSNQILASIISVENKKFGIIDNSMFSLPEKYIGRDISSIIESQLHQCEYEGCDNEHGYCLACSFRDLFYTLENKKFKSGVVLFSPSEYSETGEYGRLTLHEYIATLHDYQSMDLCDLQAFINNYDGKWDGITCKECFDNGVGYDGDYCACNAGLDLKEKDEVLGFFSF